MNNDFNYIPGINYGKSLAIQLLLFLRFDVNKLGKKHAPILLEKLIYWNDL